MVYLILIIRNFSGYSEVECKNSTFLQVIIHFKMSTFVIETSPQYWDILACYNFVINLFLCGQQTRTHVIPFYSNLHGDCLSLFIVKILTSFILQKKSVMTKTSQYARVCLINIVLHG